jgi:hypothetical protein
LGLGLDRNPGMREYAEKNIIKLRMSANPPRFIEILLSP